MAEKLRMKSLKYTILVVDDEELIRNLLVTFLSNLGHSCVIAIDGVDALDKMKRNKIDVVHTGYKDAQHGWNYSHKGNFNTIPCPPHNGNDCV
jgi:PleD family two-component response regulator